MLLLAVSLLAATPSLAPGAYANPVEKAHRTALSAKAATRDAASAAYHWATHSVTLQQAEAEQHAAALARHVATADEAFTALTGRLTARQAERVAVPLTTAREALAHARATVAKLQAEAAKPGPSRTEVRVLTAELYGTLETAVVAQEQLGKDLKSRRTMRPGPRGR